MSTPLNRRSFLTVTSLASAGSLGFHYSAKAEAGERNPGSHARLFPGCCAYSYGSYLGKGKMTMEDFIVKAVELGVVGVDITTY